MEVFVSYRSTERPLVEKLVRDIEQAGKFRVWYDQEVIGGQRWWDEIMQALEHADTVVLALSRAYLESEACQLEMDYARRLGKRILPVCIDPALDKGQLGAQLVSRQIINYPQDGVERLRMALNAVQPGTAAANVQRPEAPISPLAEVRDLITATGELPTSTQQRIVDALRWHLRRQPDDRPAVNELLRQLERKPELSRQVFDEIATLFVDDTEEAPEQSSPGFLRRLNEPWAIIVAALITAAATIAAVVFASNLNTPNTSPTPSNNPRGSQQTVNTPPAANPGPFDVTLIYGARDSFTILLNGESHLAELVLETPVAVEELSAAFSELAVNGFVGEAGYCLRYIRQGTQPPLPRGCNPDASFENILPDADVFWFDDARNQFQNIAFKQSGELVGLCPHAGGSGRCDFE